MVRKVDLGWMKNPDDYEECTWCHGRGTIWSMYPDVKEHLCHVCLGSRVVKDKALVEPQESLDSYETASAHYQNGVGGKENND